MLKEERQQLILEILKQEKKIISSEISSRLNVSEDTIRRDLKELDRQKLLRRVHSGALSIGPSVTTFDTRLSLNTNVKSKLAQALAVLLPENKNILIDGSTTNSHIIQYIPLDFTGTIITNSPDIAQRLINHHNIEVIILGGVLYKSSMISLGINTINALKNMRVDTYVMGIYNISYSEGISFPTLEEALLKQQMAAISSEIIAIATADKIETVSNNVVMPISKLSHLITNEVDQKTIGKYETKGVKVIPVI